MNRKVSVGILSYNLSGWARRILIQGGLCIIDFEKKETNTEYPILYYGSGKKTLKEILNTNQDIKLVLTNHKALNSLFDFEIKTTHATHFELNSEIAYINNEVYCLNSTDEFRQIGHHVDLNKENLNGSGILSGKYNQVSFLSFPWKIEESLEYSRNLNRMNQYVLSSNFSYIENGTWINHRKVRQIALLQIKNAINEVGLPFAYVDFKPRDKKYLCIRLDADGFSDASSEACLDLAKKIGFSYTWFVNVNDLRKNISQLTKLRNSDQDIQIHGYFHMVFNSFISNLINNGLAKWFLRLHRIKVIGSSSPLGLWNSKYFNSLRLIGINYSSDFAIGIDDIPFYPLNKENTCLQIPTYNLSIAVAGMENKELYLNELISNINQQINDKGVAIIYDHPFKRLEHILPDIEKILGFLKTNGVEIITMTQYYSMWKTRPTLKSIQLINNNIIFDFTDTSKNQKYFSVKSEKSDLPLKHYSIPSVFETKNKLHFPQIVPKTNNYKDLQRYSFLRFLLIDLKNLLFKS